MKPNSDICYFEAMSNRYNGHYIKWNRWTGSCLKWTNQMDRILFELNWTDGQDSIWIDQPEPDRKLFELIMI